jgi:chromosome partitioning protein
MKTLVVANQKGGVGKSTLAAHVAYAAAEAKKRVLLVDMDRQGSMTLTFGVIPETGRNLRASDLFSAEPQKHPLRVLNKYQTLIGADQALAEVPRMSNDAVRHPAVALRRLADKFDICVIDTPPGLSTVLVGALAAADMVVTPMPVGLYEMDGVAELFATIKSVKRGLNPALRKSSILLMKTNTRSKAETAALEQLREAFGDAILKDSLPERAAVRTAVLNRVPVWENPRGVTHEKAAAEWQKATKSILKEVLHG